LPKLPFVLEKFVPFTRELSIIAVRGKSGETAFYPLVENHHREGILRLSLAPAPGISTEIQRAAEYAAVQVLESLNYVGVLAIEFFECDGELLANEMAPRVHNSGHWTIEGAVTSQFENHLRAISGLPLGLTTPVGASAMINLIGEVPDSAQVLAIPSAHLHLYGKELRPGRKLGHVTLRAPSFDQLTARFAGLPAFFRRPDFCLDGRSAKIPAPRT
jgi:5-(carboxyamino)imidazole ribonucleotide synthase